MIVNANGDGRADLVMTVAGASNEDTWLSNGNGTFVIQRNPIWPASTPIRDGAWLPGDLNGDGLTDIVHTVENSATIESWIAQGDGTYRVVLDLWPTGPTPKAQWLIGDINGDGRDDVVAALDGLGVVLTLFSRGDGSFDNVSFSPWPGYAMPNGIWLIGHFGFSGGARSDVVHLVEGSDTANIWASLGNGTYHVYPVNAWPGYLLTNGSWMVADYDHDGFSDLIHAVRNSDQLNLWKASGAAFNVTSLSPRKGFSIGPLPSKDRIWLTGDVTGDGRPELINLQRVVPVVPLKVSRYYSVPLADEDADRIVTDMTAVLNRAEQCYGRLVPATLHTRRACKRIH